MTRSDTFPDYVPTKNPQYEAQHAREFIVQKFVEKSSPNLLVHSITTTDTTNVLNLWGSVMIYLRDNVTTRVLFQRKK